MRHAACMPATMLLAFGAQGFLDAHRKDAPVMERLRQHAHARVVDVGIRVPWLGCFEACLLCVEHHLVELLLKWREMPARGEGTGDVRRVQAVGLHACVDEQKPTRLDGAGVAHPMQRGGMPAVCHDGAVTLVVAFLAGVRVERAFEDAFAARLAQSTGQRSKHAVESVLRRGDGVAQLSHFVGVFDHAVFGCLLIKVGVRRVVGLAVGEAIAFANFLDRRRHLGVGIGDDAQLHAARAHVLGEVIGQGRHVSGGYAGHGMHLFQSRACPHPVFAVCGAQIIILRGLVGARMQEQQRRVRDALLGFVAGGVYRVEHEHGARL